jgi:WD40 repeat protein
VVRIWDAATGASLGALPSHEDVVRAVAVSPDGRHVLSGGESGDGRLRLWDLEAGTEVFRRPADFRITALAFSPDGAWAASGGGDDAVVRLWDARTWKPRGVLEHDDPDPEDSAVSSLAFSPDGRHVLMTGDWRKRRDGEWDWWKGVELWEVASGLRVWEAEAPCAAAAFSPDGALVLGSVVVHEREGPLHSIHVWDTASGGLRHVARDHNVAAFGPCGPATGTLMLAPFSLVLVDVASGRTLPPGPELSVVLAAYGLGDGLALSHDGRRLAIGREAIRVFDLAAGPVWESPRAAAVRAVAVSSDRQWIAAGHADGTVVLWRDTGERAWIFSGIQAIDAVAVCADGVWSADAAHRVRLLRLEDAGEVRSFVAGSPITWPSREAVDRREIAFSPDGTQALVAHADGSIGLWGLATAREEGRRAGPLEVATVPPGVGRMRLDESDEVTCGLLVDETTALVGTALGLVRRVPVEPAPKPAPLVPVAPPPEPPLPPRFDLAEPLGYEALVSYQRALAALPRAPDWLPASLGDALERVLDRGLEITIDERTPAHWLAHRTRDLCAATLRASLAERFLAYLADRGKPGAGRAQAWPLVDFLGSEETRSAALDRVLGILRDAAEDAALRRDAHRRLGATRPDLVRQLVDEGVLRPVPVPPIEELYHVVIDERNHPNGIDRSVTTIAHAANTADPEEVARLLEDVPDVARALAATHLVGRVAEREPALRARLIAALVRLIGQDREHVWKYAHGEEVFNLGQCALTACLDELRGVPAGERDGPIARLLEPAMANVSRGEACVRLLLEASDVLPRERMMQRLLHVVQDPARSPGDRTLGFVVLDWAAGRWRESPAAQAARAEAASALVAASLDAGTPKDLRQWVLANSARLVP